MFDFINSVRAKSRKAEFDFVDMLNDTGVTYTNKLLTSVYDLKKHTRKVNSSFDFKSRSIDKKSIILRDNYLNSCSSFMSRFNYVHMMFSLFLTVLITKKFDTDMVNFGALIKDPLFFEIFDSQEQYVLKKFNQLRNILVHTPYIELFINFSDDEFFELQALCTSLIDLEKQIMIVLKRNNFFTNVDGVK